MESSILLKILTVLVLVGVNAYFVAAEFALVAVRRARIDQRARGGDRRAKYVAEALEKPDDFISAAQLGITIASISIGYVAEDTIHAALLPYLQNIHYPVVTVHIIATIVTLFLLTLLHV